MKQGQASRDGSAGQKREPMSHAINPQAAADIGVKRVMESLKPPLRMGAGYTAPAPVGCTVRTSGSQGRHK